MAAPGLSEGELESFCQRWGIVEMSIFGSAARGELEEDSDLDLLVVFEEDAEWSLFDHVRMEEELSELAGREVDLITRRSVQRSRNWMRRNEILSSSEPVYAEG
jgi:predicted nucleotidyltransferase